MRGNFRSRTHDDLEKSVKGKSQFISVVLAGCLLAGCGTERNLAQQKLENTDQFKIDLAVYGFMLNRHFWDGDEYSAIFLQGDDAEVRAMLRQFPRHVPPIKPDRKSTRLNSSH